MEDCICLKLQSIIDKKSLDVLTDIRSWCPALNYFFVPEEVWPAFHKWHCQADTVAYHKSILLLALERGYLERVTSVVHRYLINAGLPKPEVKTQYIKDLRERWMFDLEPIERNKKYRMFAGRLAELKIAEWLELQGWRITKLEALCEGPDIAAHASDGKDTAFEVKFIGTENKDFAVILKSLANHAEAEWVDSYVAANYLLLRVYEAAKQLQRSASKRIAVVVIQDMTWERFTVQLKNKWINWANPSFFPSLDWGKVLSRQLTRYPDLANDLKPALESLNSIWIFKQSEEYQYHREFEIKLDGIRDGIN